MNNTLLNIAFYKWMSKQKQQLKKYHFLHYRLTNKQMSTSKKSSSKSKFNLTQKGQRQATRNDSSEIWKLLSTCASNIDDDQQINKNYSSVHNKINMIQIQNFCQTQRQDPAQNQFVINKQYSVRQPLKQKYQQRQAENQSQNKIKINQKFDKPKSKQKKKIIHPKQKSIQKGNGVKKQQKPNKISRQQIQQYIDQYLQSQKPHTRHLSNTAFSKLYNKPCQASYGVKNTTKDAQMSKNLLKTHNITPHILGNCPQTYQSYNNALKFCKRTKLNPDDKQLRIQRQLVAKEIDLTQIKQKTRSHSDEKIKPPQAQINQQAQTNINQLKKLNATKQQNQMKIKNQRKNLSKSLGRNEPVFIYKHTNEEGQTRLCKNSHGITCYVDSNFQENQEAIVSYLKSQDAILPAKVREQDKNIDKIRIQNYLKSKDQNQTGHYLTPCVQTPYDKSKYSRKKSVSIAG